MKKIAAGLCVALLASTASATIITDNFEVDSSANYTIRDDSNSPSGDGTADSTATFAYDYVAAGIPLAPRSTVGDVGGLRMTANDTAGQADHITAFHNTALSDPTSTKRLLVDIYMGVTGTSGTTELAHVGIGADGTDFNSIFTPIAGDGHFLAMTGEGGSSSDFRHFVEGTPVNSGDSSYLNNLHTTNATGDTYQEIFPSGSWDFPGSPGNGWVTLEIFAAAGAVRYSLDSGSGMVPIIITPLQDDLGLVSLGYTDPFTSVAAPFQSMFVIYDNLEVTPEPASLSLLAFGAIAVMRRRR
ncbi:MAG: PEP-CTERM sorting domain-containing protein [Phycisphaerales bacterium]|nr:PEP-CTERM sorting domain-containing protein [Phycisphaerales bacterium]